MTVLVVGSLHLDVVVRAPHLPVLDETVTGSAVEYKFGGKGGNQAVAIARLATDVSIAGRAGSDGFGDILRQKLTDSGVETSQLQRDEGASGMSTAIVDQNGDYGAVIVSAANLNIDPDQIRIAPETTLVLLQNEIPEAVNLAVAHKARAAGAKIWLNAAPARQVSGDLLSLVDLFIVNRVEAAYYKTLADRVDLLTTLGAEGVRYGGRHWPARPVSVISTHGAGDMFVGALAAGVVAGKSKAQAIEFAQAAAAWYVSTDPAQIEMTSSDELLKLLNCQCNP